MLNVLHLEGAQADKAVGWQCHDGRKAGKVLQIQRWGCSLSQRMTGPSSVTLIQQRLTGAQPHKGKPVSSLPKKVNSFFHGGAEAENKMRGTSIPFYLISTTWRSPWCPGTGVQRTKLLAGRSFSPPVHENQTATREQEEGADGSLHPRRRRTTKPLQRSVMAQLQAGQMAGMSACQQQWGTPFLQGFWHSTSSALNTF